MLPSINVKSLGQQCPYLISLQDKDVIGQGSFGKVVRAYNKNKHTEELACKIISVSDPKKYSSALQQLMIACKIPECDNIISYKRVKITSKNYIYIIMEYCSGGTLLQYMKNNSILNEQKIWIFLGQFIKGYQILLQQKIIHRDIKPDNILIDKYGRFKISDLGLSELILQINSASIHRGSLYYMAPQLLFVSQSQISSNVISHLNDAYSLGVILYQMCFNIHPYVEYHQSLKTFLHQIKYNSISSHVASEYSPQLLELIFSMLQKQPFNRCSWQYILYTVLKHNYKYTPQLVKSTTHLSLKFHVIQISDALLMNLSMADFQLNKSLKSSSLMIIDHIQAQILSKRDYIFFCDKLYTRLMVLNVHKQNKIYSQFCEKLAINNYLHAKQLYQNFQKCYNKIDKSEFLKVITSNKYAQIMKIIVEDYQNLYELLQEQQLLSKITNSKEIQIQIYEMTTKLMQVLLLQGHYEECCEIDQIQKWYENKNNSILSKTRRNSNCLQQFWTRIQGINQQQLKEIIYPRYGYL